jgi:hypothetical protein
VAYELNIAWRTRRVVMWTGSEAGKEEEKEDDVLSEIEMP